MTLDIVKDFPAISSKDVVLNFINSLNNLDLSVARGYVTDNMVFSGVLGSRHGAENYFSDMEKMKLKYKIQKLLFDETDVCLLYNLQISGKEIFGCGWYHLNSDKKIDSIKAIFDPRPLLDV